MIIPQSYVPLYNYYNSLTPAEKHFLSLLISQTKTDFVSKLPLEISLKILKYLDAKSLCNSCLVSKKWKSICDLNSLWFNLCKQHIDSYCDKCGWSLPLLSHIIGSVEHMSCSEAEDLIGLESGRDAVIGRNDGDNVRKIENDDDGKELKMDMFDWKKIYKRRAIVAKNWRKNSYTKRRIVPTSVIVKKMVIHKHTLYYLTKDSLNVISLPSASVSNLPTIKPKSVAIKANSFLVTDKFVICAGDSLNVYNHDFELVRKLALDNPVLDFVFVNGAIVTVGSNGIFVIDCKSGNITKLFDGHFKLIYYVDEIYYPVYCNGEGCRFRINKDQNTFRSDGDQVGLPEYYTMGFKFSPLGWIDDNHSFCFKNGNVNDVVDYDYDSARILFCHRDYFVSIYDSKLYQNMVPKFTIEVEFSLRQGSLGESFFVLGYEDGGVDFFDYAK